MQSNTLAVWLMAVLSVFFWGSNFNAAAFLVGHLSPLSAAAERFTVAIGLMLLWRLLRGRPETRLTGTDILVLSALGLIGVFGFNFAFFEGMRQTSPLNGALIMATSPLVTALLTGWLLQTPIRRLQGVGIVVSLAGVSLVVTGGHLHDLHVAPGDLDMMLACLCWSLYSVLVKKFAGHVHPIQLTRWTLGAGVLCLWIVAAFTSDPLVELRQLPLDHHLLLVYMAVFGSILAYVMFLNAVQVIGPGRIALVFNLVPVFTLIIGLAFGHAPDSAQVFGMMLVFAGVIVGSGALNGLVPSRRLVADT